MNTTTERDIFGGSCSTLKAFKLVNHIYFLIVFNEKYDSVVLRRYVENESNLEGVYCF